ncbi:hypothetical protein SJA_C2-01740 [Sphingobium indicum UT26S]|uniref:Uncharacterized protein n=1 Tax=Sphingobium indicum (strain DSM 16413 / CCM 7287 / MTCC 6362 / UT26 / NBRC 101211 / UT26S) TaxID=452662 RepID=D4Z7R8_SPHIU|nr:hypothetical protein SJA_C2-01740 [Sphingobium indicum UT26S]
MQRCAAGRRLPRRSHDFTQTGCKAADTPIGSDFGGRDDDDARARQSRLRILYASGYAKDVIVRDGGLDSGANGWPSPSPAWRSGCARACGDSAHGGPRRRYRKDIRHWAFPS